MSENVERIDSRSTNRLDILPTIVCTLGVGELVDDIDIDVLYFADLMKTHGMSDEDILSTVIRLDDELHVDDTANTTGKHKIGYGTYSDDLRTASISLAGVKYRIDYLEQQAEEAQACNPVDLNDIGNLRASMTGVHEISHRIDHATGLDLEKEDFEYYEKFTPEWRILKALRKIIRRTGDEEARKRVDSDREIEVRRYTPTHEQYLNAPDEKRARSLSNQESDNWKASYFPIRVGLKPSRDAPAS